MDFLCLGFLCESRKAENMWCGVGWMGLISFREEIIPLRRSSKLRTIQLRWLWEVWIKCFVRINTNAKKHPQFLNVATVGVCVLTGFGFCLRAGTCACFPLKPTHRKCPVAVNQHPCISENDHKRCRLAHIPQLSSSRRVVGRDDGH